MKAWEYVINTAMLGTDKPMQGNAELPDEVAEIAVMIDAVESSDKEAIFLQKAAAIYNYRQCGFTPIEQKDLPINIAADETRPYCSEEAAKILSDILNEDNTALLELWLSRCDNSGKLLLPDVLPLALDAALKDKLLQPLVIATSGNRGLWLSQLNPSWGYFSSLSDEEIWQTGKPDERINVLKKLRQTNPEQARKWLQQTWAQETATSKLDLLKILRINAGATDLEWLENLLNEKGQKVKDEALALLKLIPGSSIINQYQDLLKESVNLKKEKALLGMVTKNSIQQKLPATVDESIFKSGIEKLAGQKASLTDESFILYQLISTVPPSFWEKHFDATPEQVIGYFEKHALSQMGALVKAVVTFKTDSWIPYLLNQAALYVDFLNKLPLQQRDKYMLRFFANDPQNTINIALNCNQEWGAEFAVCVLPYMANNPYVYNRAFFHKHVSLFPEGVISQLEKMEPKDTNLQNAWEKAKDHLIKLLGLKQQTLKAFNA
jgi:hypothetical protein